MRRLLPRLAQRAGLEQRVRSHALRHSVATALAHTHRETGSRPAHARIFLWEEPERFASAVLGFLAEER